MCDRFSSNHSNLVQDLNSIRGRTLQLCPGYNRVAVHSTPSGWSRSIAQLKEIPTKLEFLLFGVLYPGALFPYETLPCLLTIYLFKPRIARGRLGLMNL